MIRSFRDRKTQRFFAGHHVAEFQGVQEDDGEPLQRLAAQWHNRLDAAIDANLEKLGFGKR